MSFIKDYVTFSKLVFKNILGNFLLMCDIFPLNSGLDRLKLESLILFLLG